MATVLDADLKRLKAHAFDRIDWAEAVLRQYHAAKAKLGDPAVSPLRGLYDWMFVPTTLWPFNVQDVLADCLTHLEKGKRLNAQHQRLMEVLPALAPNVSAGCGRNLWPRKKNHEENLELRRFDNSCQLMQLGRMAYSQTNYYDAIVQRQIRIGRATSKTEVLHQALELLDRVTRGTGPKGATFLSEDELEAMVIAGFESGPGLPMTDAEWKKIRREGRGK